MEPDAWDLVVRHDYELVSILPLLRAKLSPRNPNLTDLAGAKEQVRLYPADRAVRILHGLIDLLKSWKERTADASPWLLVCDDFDRAGTLASRFFTELMRRAGEPCALSLVAACAPGEPSRRLLAHPALAARRRVLRVDLEPGAAETVSPQEAARLAQEIENRVAGDPCAMEAHLPTLIRLWGLSDLPERALPWQYEAFAVYTSRGFYLDSIAYGEGALAHLERFHPEDEARRWKIVNKLFACNCATGHPERALQIVGETLERLRRPGPRAIAHYALAMLHARYLPHRSFPLAEQHLEEGLADLQSAGLSTDELCFQVAFNRNGLALIRHFQGMPGEAIELCRQGFESLRDNLREDEHRLHRSVLLYNIAQVYNSLGQDEQAMHHITAAMEMDPNYSEYYNDRGNIHLKKGRLEEALRDYSQAIALSPPYSEVRANLGQCYFKLGRIHEALEAFRASLDLDPAQPGLLVMQARCHESQGQTEQAVACYTASLTLEPHQPLVLANRACLLYEMGLPIEALADLDQAISWSPDNGDLYQNRAVALTDLGRSQEAVDDLETYLHLQPDAEDAAEVLLRIDELRALRCTA